MKIRSAAFTIALNNELADRRRQVTKLKRERRDEVFKAVPAIREIEESIQSIAFDMGKKVIGSDDPESIRNLAEKLIDEKTEQRDKLLAGNGFPLDYLEPQYICTICHDTGRIGGELCSCVSQLAINTAFHDSGINREQCFENYDCTLQRSKMNINAAKAIFEYALQYAESFPKNEKHDIVYFGPPGVGKTFILNCIGGRVLERGFSVLKINAHRLIQVTLDNLRSSPEERPDFILPDLLIIDDLGTEPMITNITIETLLSILSERQDLGKATLFATNLPMVSNDVNAATVQSSYGERLASRLMAPRNVRLQAIRTDNLRLSD